MTTETPKNTIIDIATGKVTQLVVSDEELAQRESDLAKSTAEAAAQQAEADAKAAARESALAKLADLGLTAEEIAAL